MKLRLKILIYIIFVISLIFVAIVGLVNYRYNKMMVSMAHRLADMYSEQSATSAEAMLREDLKVTSTLVDVFKNLLALKENRRIKLTKRILESTLRAHDQFLATWISIEIYGINPNWPYNYGRIRYIAFWESGNIKMKIDTLDLEGDDYTSIYYREKVSPNKTFITNPYLYSYTEDTASTFLETSLGAKMFISDRFIGIVGVDVSLDRFQNILNKIKPFKDSKILIVANDGTIVAHTDKKYIRNNLKNVMGDVFYFDVIKKIKEGKPFVATYSNNKKDYYVSFYPIYVGDENTPWSLGFIVPTDVILKDIRKNTRDSVLLSLLGLLIISILLWINFTSLIRPIERVTKTLEKLSMGEIDSALKLPVNRKDELGIMSLAVNSLIDALEKTVDFAIKIGQGDLDAKYNLLGPYDKFGSALLDMKNSLIKNRQLQEKQRKESEKLNWMQKGLSELNEILRLKSDNLENLSYSVLKYLIDYLNANQGGFYVIDFKNKDKIILTAAYAYERRKMLTAEFEIGEGLIGRSVKEKTVIQLSELPEGYTFITSGLGGATPNNLIILPFVFEDVVYGAIEILSFQPFEDYQIDFLKQAAERIASTISIMQKNIETKELLKQLQLQTATFEMKEKQFARMNKRLKQMQRAIELRMIEIDMIIEAFSLLASVIEIDLDKKIISVNSVLPEILSVLPEELIGKNIYEIIEKQYGEKWNAIFWDDLYKGIVREKRTLYSYNGRKVRFKEVYIPIKDKQQQVIKIVIIGVQLNGETKQS